MAHIRYYVFSRRKLYILLLFALLGAMVLTILLYYPFSVHTTTLVMGAKLYTQPHEGHGALPEPDQPDFESYVRPSKLPVLNTRIYNIDFNFQGDGDKPAKPSQVKIPVEYFKSPEESLINYFSILREAENLTPNKSGGCGTVGNSKYPFPLAYNFLAPEYQKKISFDQYLKSFEGIGHTNLIKLKDLPPDQLHPDDIRYFAEIETIEGSDKDVTYFAYYYGMIYMKKIGVKYLISDMQLSGEDFLCAPMHGWAYNAEASVIVRYGGWCKMIAEQYPTKQEGYVKKIGFKSPDGSEYLIVFMHLTNDTDLEVAQYKKAADGTWKHVYLDPKKCLENKP